MLVRPKNVYNLGSSSMTKSFEGERGRGKKKAAQTLCAVGMNLNKRKESKGWERGGGVKEGLEEVFPLFLPFLTL